MTVALYGFASNRGYGHPGGIFGYPYLRPVVSLLAIDNQTVGQPLVLECTVATVCRAIGEVSIVWSVDGVELRTTRSVNVSSYTQHSVVYTENYTTSQLHVSDNGKMYQCKVTLNTSVLVTATASITLAISGLVPVLEVFPSLIQGISIGTPQTLWCVLNNINGLDSSTVVASWNGPGGNIVTNNSRVTINPLKCNNINCTSSLQFTYLMEGDEGMYTCNNIIMILSTNVSGVIAIRNLTVPTPTISIMSPETQVVGQPLTLECNVTTVRGITSRVDIVWSSDGIEPQRTTGAVMHITNVNSVIYQDLYTISPLSTNDDGTTVKCDVMINVTPLVTATGNVTLFVRVPTPQIAMSPTGVIQGAMVGSPQHIQCKVSTINGVESSSVLIEWMGPGEELIVNNSRIIITPTISNGNNYTSGLQFTYLMEGDEGRYTCNVRILRTNISAFIKLSNLTVPPPAITMSAPNNGIVGQPLTLECNATAVRGITSRVNFVWKRGDNELQRSERASVNTTNPISVLYHEFYTIPQLNTTDDGTTVSCNVIFNVVPPVMSTNNITLSAEVPTPLIVMSPAGVIQGAIIGSPQHIQCIVSTVNGVESSSVMIEWMGPGEESIVNNSKILITPTTSNGNNYTSSLQFIYLMEGDEGRYTCNVRILRTNVSQSISLYNFTVPVPNVIVTTSNTQTVGEPTTLECNVTVVRGITSTVDIVWSSDNVELKRSEAVDASTTSSNSTIYSDQYIISQVNTTDHGRVYQCKVVINTSLQVSAVGMVTLDVYVSRPMVAILPPNLNQGVIVGSSQTIQCVVIAAMRINSGSVIITWTGSHGRIISNDSRVTISPNTVTGNNYTSTLQLAYIMEDDEGTLSCHVTILNTTLSSSIEITNLTVPSPVVIAYAPEHQIVGQSLMLQCDVFTVRGITSRVDILWSSSGLVPSIARGIDVEYMTNDSSVYTNTYIISQLSTSDQNRDYQCTAVINRNPAIAAIDAVVLNVSVPKGSVVLSQSTPRLVSGLIQGLTCIATVAKAVSPSLVTLKWSRVGLQLDSPRVVISDQTSNGLQYTKSITFSPLLSRDGGQYNCSMTVTDFNEANVISYSVVQVHAPNLTVSLLPPVLIGNAREDSIELRCTAFVSENVIEDSYKFVWMKDGSSLQSVDQRIVVTDNAISSFYEINAADTSAILHNGEYTCLVTLTIAGEDHFIKTTNGSRIILRDAIPPVQPVISAASTTSHSAYISWVVKLIVFDNETYTVWYGTDNEVQENSDVVIGNKNGLTTNEIFSVNITDLLPFTQYYYIVCAKNSIGNTNTSIMTFVTGETAPSVHPSNFRVANTTSNSVLFQWDPLISHANGIIRWYVIACSGKQSINVTGDTTRATVVGLNPFSNYNCTLHAVTVSSGPMTDPIIVRTAEKAPTPPIINTVTAINSMSLRVDWSTPSEANGILLIYSITYTNENGLKTINVPFNKQATQFYIIGGLAPYELVTVTITATNGGGTSSPSNELTGRTQQAASGVVQITTVISLSSNSVNVQWTPPSQSNGIITGYQVTYSVLDMNDAKVTSAVASNENNLNITDLSPGTPYQVVVLALNGAGKGQENKNRIFFSKELNPLNEPKNIVVTRTGTSANVTWDSLTLFEARGFPVYMVTLIPSSNSAVRTRRQSSDGIISINTTESSVVVEGLDENIEYNLSLAVATTAGIMEADKVVPVDESSTDEFRDNSSGNNSSVIIFAASGVAIVVLIIAFIIIAVCLVQKRKKKDGYSTDQHIYDTVGLQSQVMQNHGLINDTTFRTNVTMPLKIHNPNLHGEYCEEVQENPYYLDTEVQANPAYQVADISTL